MPPKKVEELEKVVENLQKDVQKISELENDVKEMKKQLGKLDVLERLEKRLIDEERRSWVTEKKSEEESHVSGVEANQVGGSQTRYNQSPTPMTGQTQTRSTSPERNEPLTRKIEIPLFDGENADGWVLRIEQYFELSEFTEEEKLKAVRMCFDDEALTWYRWKRDRNPFTSWEQMKNRVLENFSTTQDMTPGERLLLLRQEDTAGRFCKDFIALASNAPELPEKVREMAFMIGLKPKLRAGVKMFEPRSLKKMMSMAKKVEEWSGDAPSENMSEGTSKTTTRTVGERFVTRGSQYTNGGVISSNHKVTNPQDKQTPPFRASGDKTLNPQIRNSENRRVPYRRLTDAEANERRSKGLCFRCDERYHAGHKCRLKELQVLVVSEEGSEGDLTEDVGETKEDAGDEVAECAVLSLNSAAGISSPRTMKLRGKIQEREVKVLIDSGASHNFLSHALARQLGITTRGTLEYGVRMGTRLTVRGTGVCQGVVLELPDYTLITSFLPLELGGVDAILGMQWLETLGEMKVNWRELVMKFTVEGRSVTVRGDPSLCNTAVSLKSLWKTLRLEGEGILVEFNGFGEIQI